GAIFNTSSNSLTFNDFVSFGGYLKDKDGNLILDDEGEKISVGNMAIAKETLDAEGNVVASGNAYGGVFYSDGSSNVEFSSTHQTSFISNSAISESAEAYGGAISSFINPSFLQSLTVTFKETSLFQDNIAQGATKAYGGAIYNESRQGGGVILSDVSFLGNKALSSEGESYGGAISNVKYQKEDGTYIHATTSINGPSLFQDNIAQGATKAYGGAIYNEGGTKNNDGTIKTAGVTLSDVSFIGNKAESTTTDGEAKGGAIYNKGIMKFNGEALFENNIAKHGGAIYNDIGATLEFNKKAEFVGNEASARGSSIFNNSGTITFNDDAIFNNNKGTGWGTIVNQYATINFNDGAEFKNNKLDGGWQHGAGIFNLSAVLNFNNPDKIIVFEGNSVDGCGGSLYNIHGKANFNGFVIFKGKEIIDPITGETDLIRQAVTGGALFNDHGTTVFEKGVLFEKNRAQNGGAIGISSGTVTFKNGVEFSGNRAPTGNDVYFNDAVGTINFGAVPEDLNQLSQTETGAEIVEGGFASKDEKGIVNKYSNSTLTFLDSADNTGFKGSFNQYIGKTIAHSEKFLAGTNNILGGVLETHGAKIGYTANIGDETHTASLIHHSTATGNSDPTSLTTALKIGASSTALFDSATNGVQANYALTDDVAGAGTVTFKDAHLTLGQTNYNGAYVMGENVTLNMQDGDAGDSVSFANLTGSANLKIDADIVNGANGLELVTDKIATNQEATLKLNLTDVVLSEKALDNGLSESYTATVMKGGTLTYGSEKGLVATDIYSYEVSGANNQITIDAVKFNEGSDVMKSVAEFDGDAAFNMTIGGDSYEMKSDVTMTKNTKSIIGKGKETSTLTAKKITVDGATLNVENVSVSGENQLIDVASGTLNITNAKVDNIKNAGEATLNTAEVSELENAGTLTANGSEIGELLNGNKAEVTGGKVTMLTNTGTLTANGSTIGAIVNGNKAEVTGGKVTKVTNTGTLTVNGSEIGELVNEKDVEVMGGKVTILTNKGTMTANGSEIGELVNEHEAEVTGGEFETATNKEKGMLSLSAGLRAGTVTNEGKLTLDEVTVADLTNSATLKTNGSTLTKLVNEQEAELTASTVEDLTNTGKMTAKDLTLKGVLKGSGTATLSGKLVADDIF
ncbi:MAG: hypothetical protein IJD25_04015, partial [Alphaproteobacteria bacterium]|nr:hypothetical protein [Alphaproteobacteria bacterium]